jgi:hypothetical protein
MAIDARYGNPATMQEKKQTLEQDRTATTYFQRAQNERGQELGRFSHLVKDLAITGLSQPHGGQPPDGYYGINSRLPDEPPLGYSIDQMEPIGGPPETAGLPRTEGPSAAAISHVLPCQDERSVDGPSSLRGKV